jgi:hypothetical protein
LASRKLPLRSYLIAAILYANFFERSYIEEASRLLRIGPQTARSLASKFDAAQPIANRRSSNLGLAPFSREATVRDRGISGVSI